MVASVKWRADVPFRQMHRHFAGPGWTDETAQWSLAGKRACSSRNWFKGESGGMADVANERHARDADPGFSSLRCSAPHPAVRAQFLAAAKRFMILEATIEGDMGQRRVMD